MADDRLHFGAGPRAAFGDEGRNQESGQVRYVQGCFWRAGVRTCVPYRRSNPCESGEVLGLRGELAGSLLNGEAVTRLPQGTDDPGRPPRPRRSKIITSTERSHPAG